MCEKRMIDLDLLQREVELYIKGTEPLLESLKLKKSDKIRLSGKLFGMREVLRLAERLHKNNNVELEHVSKRYKRYKEEENKKQGV